MPSARDLQRRLQRAQRQLARAETLLSQARAQTQRAEAVVMSAQQRVVACEGALRSQQGGEREVLPRPRTSHPPTPPAREIKPIAAPAAAITRQHPDHRPRRAPLLRTRALSRLARLLPRQLEVTSAGRHRHLALHAGRTYQVRPLNRRRRKFLGERGTLRSWDMGGTMGLLQRSDGSIIPVRLEDLVEIS